MEDHQLFQRSHTDQHPVHSRDGGSPPSVFHPLTPTGTTYHWQRPGSWLAASPYQTGCWARCRFHHHFGSWGDSDMVRNTPGQLCSFSPQPLPRVPKSSALSPCQRPVSEWRRGVYIILQKPVSPFPGPTFCCLGGTK